MVAKKSAGKNAVKSAKKTSKPVAKKAPINNKTKVANQSDNSIQAFPNGVAQPAVRALASIGVTKVEQLSKHRESDLAALHGMGPKALGILKDALKSKGRSFKA